MKVRTGNQRQKGNLVISMAIALVVVITLGMLMNYLLDFNKSLKREEANGVVQAFFVSLKGVIDNDATWRTILGNNATLGSCILSPNTYCVSNPTTASGNLTVVNLLSVPIDNNPASGNGIDPWGVQCSTYPSTGCPYKFIVTWTLKCKDGGAACPTKISPLTSTTLDPLVSIHIELLTVPGSLINREKYKMDFTRGGSGSLEAACRAANADYNPSTQSCVIKADKCPSGQIFKGLDSVGRPYCGPNVFTSTKCSSGYAITGFNRPNDGGGASCFKY